MAELTDPARARRPDEPPAVDAPASDAAADDAITRLRARLRRAADPLPDLRRLADLQRAAGQPGEAAETAREILALAPGDPDAFALVAAALTAGERWPELIALHREALAADPDADAPHRLAIAAVQLDRLGAADDAFATLAHGPDATWSDPRALDLAHRAAAASADRLARLEALAPPPAPAPDAFDPASRPAPVGPRAAAARALADRLAADLPAPARARLAAWYEAHGHAEPAAEQWRAVLADRDGADDPRAWYGVARHLTHDDARLAAHLDAMARAPLPRRVRVAALRRLAAAHRRRGAAAAEAEVALARAEDLARPRGRRVLRALVLLAVLLLLAAIAYDLTRVYGISLP